MGKALANLAVRYVMTLGSTLRAAGLAAAVLALAACERKDKPREAASPTAEPAVAQKEVPKVEPPAPAAAIVEVPEVRIRAKGDTTIRVNWVTPSGTTVNDEAPFRVRWNRSDGLADAPNDVKSTGSTVKEGFSVKVQPMKGAPNPTLAGEISIVVCDSVTHSVCVPVRRTVELGFVVVPDATEVAMVSIPLPAAK